MNTRTIFYAGAPLRSGTEIPSNVTGECCHMHRTYLAAKRCITDTDRAIKRGHGRAAYCDRVVMRAEAVRVGRRWLRLTGTTEPA